MKIFLKCLLIFVGILFLAGCFSRSPYIPIQYYSINDPTMEIEVKDTPLDKTLAVRDFEAASSLGKRMMKRISQVEVTYLDYNRWVRAPHESVTSAFVSSLEKANLFKAIYSLDESPREAGSYVLSGSVERFEWVDIDDSPWALLEVRLHLRSPGRGEALWSRRIVIDKPMSGKTPQAFALAMNQAVSRATVEVAENIREALQP